jgi:hypothetical protein
MKDASILRLVVLGLVGALLVVLVGSFVLISMDKALPSFTDALSFSIVTGLLGLLAPSRTAAAGE